MQTLNFQSTVGRRTLIKLGRSTAPHYYRACTRAMPIHYLDDVRKCTKYCKYPSYVYDFT